MEALLAGEEAGLTVKEQTVLLVFLDHCFNSLVRRAPTICMAWRIYSHYFVFCCILGKKNKIKSHISLDYIKSYISANLGSLELAKKD